MEIFLLLVSTLQMYKLESGQKELPSLKLRIDLAIFLSFYLFYLGLADFVTVTHRDVIENGFNLPHKADAVFLDLPNPHSAIQHAKEAFKLEGG